MKMKISARRARRQKGAAMVESALVMITLVGMIVFVMDIGRMLMTEMFITERARTAVRGAVVNNWDSTAVANYLVYNSTTSPDNVNGVAPTGYMGLQTSQVTFTALGTSGSADYRYQVKVSGLQMFTWIPWIAGRYTAPPVTVTMPAQSLGATN